MILYNQHLISGWLNLKPSFVITYSYNTEKCASSLQLAYLFERARASFTSKLISHLQAAIQETTVLLNCESIHIPWMPELKGTIEFLGTLLHS